MKIDKNSDIGKNLLEALTGAIPELRDAIKNGDIDTDSIEIVELYGKKSRKTQMIPRMKMTPRMKISATMRKSSVI